MVDSQLHQLEAPKQKHRPPTSQSLGITAKGQDIEGKTVTSLSAPGTLNPLPSFPSALLSPNHGSPGNYKGFPQPSPSST